MGCRHETVVNWAATNSLEYRIDRVELEAERMLAESSGEPVYVSPPSIYRVQRDEWREAEEHALRLWGRLDDAMRVQVQPQLVHDEFKPLTAEQIAARLAQETNLLQRFVSWVKGLFA